MIGIYKITNKLNGKIYVGQSNDVHRRMKEHCYPGRHLYSTSPIDHAIHKYGEENFTFEVLEECTLDKLNELETFWILELNSMVEGYNCNQGGDQASVGSNNGRTKLTEEDVEIIRTAYNNHERCKQIYEMFKDRISYPAFQQIWQGKTWKHVMPEVLTEENKKYYSSEATNGSKSPGASLADEEVMIIRQRYVDESAKQIYEDYKDRLSYQTLQQILWGRYYKDLPIYSKKKKQWITK